MPAESHRRCNTQPVDPHHLRGFAGAALGVLLAVLLCCASWVQAQPRPRGGDVFSATESGRGGDTFGASATDTSRCRDPQIAVIERRERARAYLDTTGKVKMAADYLARKHGDPFVNRGSVCMHHPGVIFMIPEQFDAEFRQLLDVFNASPQPDEKKRDDTGPRPSPLRPGTPLLSRSGCPFPPELDPRNMDPRLEWEARLQTAESVISQRQRLCQQGQGYLVKETCARVCAAEPQAQNRRPAQIRRSPAPEQPASCTPPQARRHPGGLEPAEEYARGFVEGILSCVGGMTVGTAMTLWQDGGDFALTTAALIRGDAETAARILDIKGQRNRLAFDAFVHSLNPNVVGATPRENGYRQGARLCAFGAIPGFVRAATAPRLPPGAGVPPGPTGPTGSMGPQPLPGGRPTLPAGPRPGAGPGAGPGTDGASGGPPPQSGPGSSSPGGWNQPKGSADSGPPPLGSPAFPTVEARLFDIGWLRKINPSGSDSNCASVAVTVEMILRGKNPLPAHPAPGLMPATTELFIGKEFGPYLTAAQANQFMVGAGHLARGIIRGERANGAGHQFNIVNYRGAILLLDGQDGVMSTWQELSQLGFQKFQIIRTDL